MYYTPKSYKSGSRRISSSVRPNSSFGPTTYPTPPQTHENTDYLSIPSTSITVAGLGIQNCGVESLPTQLPICAPSQPLLQPSQCWPQATPSSGSFSNPSPNIGDYDRLGFFDDIAGLPTQDSSPFVVPSSHANTPGQFTFFSPHQPQNTVGNPVVQRGLGLDDYGLTPQTGPLPKQQQRMGKPALTSGSAPLPMNRVPLKRSFTHVESPPTQAPTSVSPYVGHNLPGTPLQAGSNVGRSVDHSRVQRSPLGSSNVNTQVEPTTTSTPVHDQPVKRQRKKSTAVVKYKCENCGKVFTRNSNRKSHMKTHDPNRNFPHKCTFGDCTKEFSRKTDLARHVDSVHKKSRKFRCDQCGESFARRDTLRRHCDDGCRRRQRQSQRSGNDTAPVTLGSESGHRSYPPQHTYQQTVTTSETQTFPTFIGQSFPGSGPDSFSQLIA